MRDSYEEVLQRLVQCRQLRNMTQDDVSTMLGTTQSQYSKMELGKVVISYKSLKILMEAGWDVDYLITGKESLSGISELSALTLQLDERDKKELLNALAWLLEQGVEKSIANIGFETKCEIGILKMRASEASPGSVMYEIRKLSGMAQIPMSEKLGVNIKKYRMLEKEKTYPDAELLLRIYDLTGCKPSLLFGNDDIEIQIIDDLWNQIVPDVRKKILSLAEQVLWFVKS